MGRARGALTLWLIREIGFWNWLGIVIVISGIFAYVDKRKDYKMKIISPKVWKRMQNRILTWTIIGMAIIVIRMLV